LQGFPLSATAVTTALCTREGTALLPDGRHLAWSSGGPQDGVPVLYLHGAIGTPVRRTPEHHFVPVEHARVVAATLPRCRARFDADDGLFFFRRRLEDVLGALVAAFGH
jgi:hypothetical protein